MEQKETSEGIEVELLRFGVPYPSGRVYTKVNTLWALTMYSKQVAAGTAVGHYGGISPGPWIDFSDYVRARSEINLHKVALILVSITGTDEGVRGVMRPYGPMKEALMEILKENPGKAIRLAPRSMTHGHGDAFNVVKFIGFDFTNDSLLSWEDYTAQTKD